MNVYKVEFGDGTFDDFALFSKVCPAKMNTKLEIKY